MLPSSAELIEDVRDAPEDILSRREPFMEVCTAHTSLAYTQGSFQVFQAEYTFGVLNEEDRYHNHVIRSRLTRSIAAIFNEVHDEAVEAWTEFIPVTSNGMQYTHRGRIGFLLTSRMGQGIYSTDCAANNLSCL